MKLTTLIAFIFIIFNVLNTYAQDAYRFESKFLFKAKSSDSNEFKITKGKVVYDKSTKSIFFENSFPQKEQYYIQDTTMLIYQNDSLIESRKNIIPPEHTMFSYILNGNLINYDLGNNGFERSAINKKDGLIIKSYLPNINYGINKYIGKVLISSKNKKLHSVVLYNAEMRLINRQIFKKYKSVGDFIYPSEIISVTYSEDSTKYYQITTLSEVKTNDEVFMNFDKFEE